MHRYRSLSLRLSPASALLMLLVALPSHSAGVYTCVRDGKPLLTDRPCESAAAPSAALNVARPPVISASETGLAERRDRQPAEAPTRAAPQAASNPASKPAAVVTTIAQQLALYAAVIFGGLGIFHYLRRTSQGQWRATPSAERLEPDPSTPEADGLRVSAVDGETLPYRAAPLMSRYEQVFFQRLREALPEYEIFPQVPLAAFIRVDRKKAGKNYWLNSYRWQNRIGQQRVDYLVCHKDAVTAVAAIELDDPSHEAEEANERDTKKNKSLADAAVRLIRWRVERMPKAEDIRREFRSAPI